MTSMLLRKRQHDFLRRRNLLVAVLAVGVPWFSGTTARAEDVPSNRLRIVTTPILAPAGSIQPSIALDEKATPATSKNADTERSAAAKVNGDLQLVSDGWVARNAIDSTLPLIDPAPAKPAYAASKKLPESEKSPAASQSADAEKKTTAVESGVAETMLHPVIDEPRSTLNFIIPQTSAPALGSTPKSEAMDARGTKVDRQESVTTKLINEQFGPGDATFVKQSVAPDKATQSDSAQTQQSAVDTSTDSVNAIRADELGLSAPVMDPEQNEPAPTSGGTESAADVGVTDEADDDNSNAAGLTDEESMDLADPSQNEATDRIEIRSLRKIVDDSTSSNGSKSPAFSKPLRTEPASNRNEARQSIGDELDLPPVPGGNDQSRDKVNANGDLILAIGLANNVAITPSTAKLRVPIEKTLNYYWNRPEDAAERTHWGMFHQMMIFDKDTSIVHQKRKYNAVAWMAGNNQSRNQLLFEQDGKGIVVKEGIGLQGHQAQMLAVFGLIDVPAAYPIYVGRNKYTVQDVVRREMLACKSGQELTFTLIGVSHYLDSDVQWVANDGQDWNVERLIQEELTQPIVGAACGGTHRLMGFAHALRRRRAEGKPITGQWARADKYITDFIEYTWQLQNRDGSMSTAWFESSEDNGKLDRKIQTTGHMLEFLVTAVPEEELQSPRMLRSMNYLVSTLYQERGHEWQVGPKGHALRALAMYYRNVFSRPDPWRPVAVARHGNSQSR